jgi:hypothetical protein
VDTWIGPTVSEPLVPLVPLHPPEAPQATDAVLVQESRLVPPAAMAVGEAVRVTVGVTAAALTAAIVHCMPPIP